MTLEQLERPNAAAFEAKHEKGTAANHGAASNGRAAFRTVAAVPAFNEAVSIASVVLQAREHVDLVVVVDDGSMDDTARIAELAGARVIKHEKNSGKGAAVRTIFDWARAVGVEALVLLDGDMQHDPREIPKVLAPIVEGKADLSLGFRFGNNTEMPSWRRVGKRVLDYATAAGTNGEVTDSQCGYRAFSRRAIERLSLGQGGFGIESEMLIDAKAKGLSLAEVPITCRYDGVDGSTKGPVAHAMGVLSSLLRMVTERQPLVWLGIPSVMATVTGITLGMWVLYVLQATGELAIGTTVLSSMLMLAGLFTGLAAVIFHVIPRAVAAHVRPEPTTTAFLVQDAAPEADEDEEGAERPVSLSAASASMFAAGGLERKR